MEVVKREVVEVVNKIVWEVMVVVKREVVGEVRWWCGEGNSDVLMLGRLCDAWILQWCYRVDVVVVV